MISVIVYGRNDHHGYNFHKRAAISLNCLAEVLTDPDDEILFTDYNTPDAYPTLVEAIRDTLTDRCRRRLRVFRVRPAVHERYRERTHLEVVEAVSRNVALRRSNPANRWVLSTNTDMIFVPRDPGRSLSDIAAGRADGFYHLPRFELPETLWESVDRRDPRRIVETVRCWGTQLSLNEVVHTDAYARFDGIGDCQLVLRRDLFAIGGFHEGMLVGWNVDMNLCRRLRHLHPETGSLLDSLFGYHCDHTRTPTAALSATAIQNDPHVFVDGVTRADLPEQAASWGLAGEDVEEHSGTDLPADRFVAALEAAAQPMTVPCTEARNDRSAYLALTYPPDHVLPYAADHLSTLPRDAAIGFVGGSSAMLGRLVAVWRGMGGEGPVLALDTLGGDGAAEAVPLEAMHRRAGVFVIDFSLDPGAVPAEPVRHVLDLATDARERLGRVKGAFIRLVALARRDGGAAMRRMFVCLNGINTYFGTLARTELLFTWTPFTTRVCFGPVRPDDRPVAPLRSGGGMERHLETALGRGFAIDPWEVAMLRKDLAVVADAADLDAVDPRRFSAPLVALLGWPGAAAAFRSTPERVGRLRRAAAARRPSAGLRNRLDPRFLRPGEDRPAPPPLSKLADAADWEDGRWRLWAERYTREGLGYVVSTYNYFKRSHGVWERVQILYALDRLGLLMPQTRIGVATAGPDGLPAFLADRMGRVDVVDLQGAPHPAGTEARRVKNRLFCPDRAPRPEPSAAPWHAAVFIDPAAGGPDPVRVRALSRRVVPGGPVLVCGRVCVSRGHPACGEAVDRLRRFACAHETSVATAWTVGDPTLDRVAGTGPAERERPYFVAEEKDGFYVSFIICLDADRVTAQQDAGHVL